MLIRLFWQMHVKRDICSYVSFKKYMSKETYVSHLCLSRLRPCALFSGCFVSFHRWIGLFSHEYRSLLTNLSHLCLRRLHPCVLFSGFLVSFHRWIGLLSHVYRSLLTNLSHLCLRRPWPCALAPRRHSFSAASAQLGAGPCGSEVCVYMSLVFVYVPRTLYASRTVRDTNSVPREAAHLRACPGGSVCMCHTLCMSHELCVCITNSLCVANCTWRKLCVGRGCAPARLFGWFCVCVSHTLSESRTVCVCELFVFVSRLVYIWVTNTMSRKLYANHTLRLVGECWENSQSTHGFEV